MFLCRDYGAKGIYKFFCYNCNDFFYVSASGKDTDHDYMYQAADFLTGNIKVTVNGDDAEQCYQYEYDNDYETYDIMHRVDSPSERIHTFVKGKRYYEFMKKLFPPSVRAAKPIRCPYCGSDSLGYSCIAFSAQKFYADIDVGRTRMQALQNLTEQHLNKIVSEAENKTLCSPTKPAEVDVCAYINNLVSIEKEILSCTGRYRSLYYKFLLIQRNIIHDYVETKMPDRDWVPDAPQKPPFRFVGLVNREQRKKEIQQEKKNYKEMVRLAGVGRALYDDQVSEFSSKAVSYFGEGTAALKSGNMQTIFQSVPITTEKFRVISADLCECESQLSELVGIKKKLLSMQVVYPKYAVSLQALMMIAEYLNSGRCTELAGPYGAYNMYELEHRLDTLIDNQGIMQAIVERSFSALNETIRYEMQTIGNKLDTLDSSLSGLMDAVDDIRVSSAKAAYESQQTAYYAELTASRTGTLEFLSIYDHLTQ